MAPPLSQAKLAQRKRDNLRGLHQRILGAWSLKQITDWSSLYKHLGQPFIQHSEPLTFPILKQFLAKQTEELEQEIKNESVKVDTTPTPSVGPVNLQDSKEKAQKSNESTGQVRTANETKQSSTNETSNALVVSPPPLAPVTETPTVSSQTVTQTIAKVYDGKEDYSEKNDYGYTRSPNVDKDFFPYWFQKKATMELFNGIVKHKKRGQLLLSSTGTGKTFIVYDLMRHLEDIQFHEMKTFSHIPYLIITRATVVEQTERVGLSRFNLGPEHHEVINIEQLRSAAGRLWVKEEKTIVNGEDKFFWKWKDKINPCVVLLDECQAVKNDTSTQHEIMSAYNNLPTRETYQVFISATPFTRVSEAKCFAVSTHRNIEHLGFPKGTVLTNETWPAYAAAIASPSKPDEYNEAAVDRLMNDLDNYVVRVKNVRPQFDAINSVQMIDFQTREERDYYLGAYERYLKEKAKLEAQGEAGANNTGIMILVQFLKFRMAAEYCRRYHLAKAMYESVQGGKAAVCALNFKSTIIAIVQILVNDYNVPRSEISLVWGGGQTQLTKKQKAKQKIRDLSAKFEAMGMSAEEMIEDMDLSDVEDRIIEELDPSLRLGPQSKDERQYEIDRFQSGKSLYCLFTFRAGGVGLSLHHTDELTKEKCRRKESGYAVEEDISKIPVRPRECFAAPTYSAIELVQGLGRCPRLTSLSNTSQTLVFYRGTIEVDVAAIVRQKLKCLAKVVRQRESWNDIVTNESSRSRTVQAHLEAVPEEDSGSQSIGMIGEGDEE